MEMKTQLWLHWIHKIIMNRIIFKMKSIFKMKINFNKKMMVVNKCYLVNSHSIVIVTMLKWIKILISLTMSAILMIINCLQLNNNFKCRIWWRLKAQCHKHNIHQHHNSKFYYNKNSSNNKCKIIPNFNLD